MAHLLKTLLTTSIDINPAQAQPITIAYRGVNIDELDVVIAHAAKIQVPADQIVIAHRGS